MPAIVKCTWVDAETGHGWEENKDVPGVAPTVITVGFLIKKSRNAVVIASTVGADDTSNARITIPKKMIVKLEEINANS